MFKVNKNLIFKSLIIFFTLSSPFKVYPLFKNFIGDGNITLSSALDRKKEQLKKNSSMLFTQQEKQKLEKEQKEKIISKIDQDIEITKQNLKDEKKEDQEYLNKKITLLNDRKQIILQYLDTYSETISILNKRTIIIEQIINFLQNNPTAEIQSVYTWQEFKKAQAEEAELINLIEQENTEKESLLKHRVNEKDITHSLQKQLNSKKEREKNLTDENETSKENIKHTKNLADEELNLLKEKIELSLLKTTKFDFEIDAKYDERELSENKLEEHKQLLNIIEEKLIIDSIDLEAAKENASKERQKVFSVKEEFNKKIDIIKVEKNKLEEKLTEAKQNLEEVKDKKDSDTGFIPYYQAISQHTKIKSIYNKFDKEILLLNIQNDLAAIKANKKELEYQIVDVRHKLNKGKLDTEKEGYSFKNEQQLAISDLKRFKSSKNESTKSLIEVNNELKNLSLIESTIKEKKDTIFIKKNLIYQKILENIESTRKYINDQLLSNNKYLGFNADLVIEQEKNIKQYSDIINQIEKYKSLQEIWERSPKAITYKEFRKSILKAESFFIYLFWDTPKHLGPYAILRIIKKASPYDFLLFLLFFIFFFLLHFLIKTVLSFILKKARLHLASEAKLISFLPLNILISFLNFMLEHVGLILGWIFIYLHILFNFKYVFSTINFLSKKYYISLFYLITIPIFFYLSNSFLQMIKELNKRLSFLFFAEKIQDRFILFITFFCYSTAILIPLRLSFLTYHKGLNETFSSVLLAAYSLIIVMILLFFFSKEDVLRFIPSKFSFFIWLKKKIEKHYYPVFIFLMSILILYNPYIGYSNLAWFLLFAVPSTTLVTYSVFVLHGIIRKYSVFIFMKEEGDEIVDKFEHAKTYYGILIIVSFLLLLFVTFIFVARLWNYNYSTTDIWIFLSEKWTVPVGPKDKLGFIELFIFVVFITSGFFVSSLINRFGLNKLYDILRTEPGTQNTISKIFHYLTISVSIILGFIYIHLEGIIYQIGMLIAIGLGLAFKDLLTDYVAGFLVLIERPIEIGNFVRINDEAHTLGTIHKIDARTTTIMTRLNHSIIIPNKDLINKAIVNMGKGRFAVGFEMFVYIDYSSDIVLAKKTIMEVIKENPAILRVPNPVTRIDNFDASSLVYLIRAFISSRRVRDQWIIAGELRESLIENFRKLGIEFAFPQIVVHKKIKTLSKNDPESNNGNNNSSFDEKQKSPTSPIQIKFDE